MVSGPILITLQRGVYTDSCGSTVVEHSTADPSYQGFDISRKEFVKKPSHHHKKKLLVSGPTLITLLRGVYTDRCRSAMVEHSTTDPWYQRFDISHKEFVKKPSRHHKKNLLVSGPTLITLLRGVYTDRCCSTVVESLANDPRHHRFDISRKEFVKKPSCNHKKKLLVSGPTLITLFRGVYRDRCSSIVVECFATDPWYQGFDISCKEFVKKCSRYH